MNAIYLINITTNAIAGRFESVTDAELAGELLRGTDGYYVGDREDLAKWKMAELFKLAQSVGETAPNWNFKAKTWGIDRLVELADAFDFAPPAPSKPEPAPKAPRTLNPDAKCWKRPTRDGVVKDFWALCDVMEGQPRKAILEAAAAAGYNPNMAKTQFGRWQHRC